MAKSRWIVVYIYLLLIRIFHPLHNAIIGLLKKDKKQKIFCIGFAKTGTTSLHKALSILGYRVVRFPFWQLYYNYGCDKYVKKIINSNYDAFIEYPINMEDVWPVIDKTLSDCKFILTIRDSESFKKSHYNYFKGWPLDKDFKDSDLIVKKYEKEQERIINHFKKRPSKLLVLNIIQGDGWEKLCRFLNKPIPSQPFPHKNKTNYKRNN